MNLLADENIERLIVLWLREQGHDVLWVPESSPSVLDHEIVNMARDQKRVILTYDLDFGEILFRERFACDGVILLRCTKLARQHRLEWFQRWWPDLEAKAPHHFIILQNNKLRIRSFWREK